MNNSDILFSENPGCSCLLGSFIQLLLVRNILALVNPDVFLETDRWVITYEALV